MAHVLTPRFVLLRVPAQRLAKLDEGGADTPSRTSSSPRGCPAAAAAYALRHSTITDLIALHRLDTLTVAQLSGTSLQMIEKHYGHLLREHAAKALASLTL